jgi:hypothetical protein
MADVRGIPVWHRVKETVQMTRQCGMKLHSGQLTRGDEMGF